MIGDGDDILSVVIRHYMRSRDFNGISLSRLALALSLSDNELRRELEDWTARGDVGVLVDANPHILGRPLPSVGLQREWLQDRSLEPCIYPTERLLQQRVPNDYLLDEPFSRALALGGCQYNYCFFELQVLEPYANEPGYSLRIDDIIGSVTVTKKGMDRLPEHDHIMLNRFGFGHRLGSERRVVAVPLRHLHELSAHHQQSWRLRMIDSECSLHPQYRDWTQGLWTSSVSACAAVLRLVKGINEVCKAAGRRPLFRDAPEEQPVDFQFLWRATQKAYDGFVHVCDKILSESIDKDFFGEEVSRFEEIERKDGTVERKSKGTIQMLQEWLEAKAEREEVTAALSPLREVRKQRQKPAHSLVEDCFSDHLQDAQVKLLRETVDGLEALLSLLQEQLLESPLTDPAKLNGIEVHFS